MKVALPTLERSRTAPALFLLSAFSACLVCCFPRVQVREVLVRVQQGGHDQHRGHGQASEGAELDRGVGAHEAQPRCAAGTLRLFLVDKTVDTPVDHCLPNYKGDAHKPNRKCWQAATDWNCRFERGRFEQGTA